MKRMRKVLLVLMASVMMLALVACGGGGDSYSEFTWPDSELATILPQPDMELKGEVTKDDDEKLEITIAKASSEDFDAYVELCDSEGFNLEISTYTSHYSAKNEQGYKLSVGYDDDDKTLELALDASGVYSEFSWPDSEIAQLIPVPKSNYGTIDWEASYGFVIYVSQTSIDDFNEYVDSCKECGFTVDYQAGDDYYYADNESGYHLDLKYEDGNVMFVRMDEPDEETATETDEVVESETTETEVTEEEDTTASDVSDSDIRPEFKEAMDSYEAFFDEYVEFMQKYQESDDATSMLTDYANYMSQYAETMEKLGELEDENMTTAEAAYYLEVTTRINQKILEVAQ